MDSIGLQGLNEALECSVCLETLGPSSKVLPCQHTFCTACLKDVYKIHKELRCPECRSLVNIPLENLKPNILLMRILEGMKPHPQSSSEKKKEENLLISPISLEKVDAQALFDPLSTLSINTLNINQPPYTRQASSSSLTSFQNSNIIELSSQVNNSSLPSLLQPNIHQGNINNPFNVLSSTSVSQPSGSLQLSTLGSSSTNSLFSNVDDISLTSSIQQSIQRCSSPFNLQAKALFNYDQRDQRDLSFKKGDSLKILKQIDDNWYKGELNGQQGIIPAAYIKILDSFAINIPQCRALYDFKIQSNEEKNCLTFNQGDIITLLRRVDENWAEGKFNSHIGIFPLSFVKLNNAARSLLKLTISANQDEDFLPATTSISNSGISPTSTTNSTTLVPISTRSPESSFALSPSQTRPSRNSFPGFENSFTPLNPVIVSTATRAAPSESVSVVTCSQPVGNGHTPNESCSNTKKDTSTNLLARLQRLSSLHLYVATHGYYPRKADELELKKGNLYSVTDKCDDGWFKGQCIHTDKSGVFPGNYAQMAKAETIAAYVSRTSSKSSPSSPLHNNGSSSQRPSNLFSPNLLQPDMTSLLDTPVNFLVPTLSPTHSRSLIDSMDRNCDDIHTISFTQVTSSSGLPPRQYTTSTTRTPENRKIIMASLPTTSPPCIPEKKSISGSSIIKKLVKKRSKSPLFAIEKPLIQSSNVTDSQKASLIRGENKSNAHPVPLVRERYRCVVGFPSTESSELDLKIGDVVYVHNKSEDGWFKGTHQITGKTGMFPANFVEHC